MGKILVIGSTGKLGVKLLNFCYKYKIKINSICCFKNKKKILLQSKKYNINNYYTLIDEKNRLKFCNDINKNKFKIIYFLDYGSFSLFYLNLILKFQTNCIIAIANKELILAGGKILVKKIFESGNKLIPLDSEHFSAYNKNLSNNFIKKIYITASGGPFYFNKNINLKNVSKDKVLSHPKWKMGNNNLIDSSNFINKILEIYEFSFLYNIDINKIDFLVSPHAYVHSIIFYKDNTISINCFENDMIITLVKPLSFFYKFDFKIKQKSLFNSNSFYFEEPKDDRFPIFKKKKIKELNHHQLIQLIKLNNIAQKLYLDGDINYSDIINFIFKRINMSKKQVSFTTINGILKYIKVLDKKYLNLKK